MTRRRVVVLSSALVLLALGLVAAIVVLATTQTDFGREQVRSFLASRLAANVHGKLHIGRIGGSLLTGVTIDSLEIRDELDSLLVATGRITVNYDPRDLVDRRILISHLDIENPVVRLAEDDSLGWNYKRVFRREDRRRLPTQGGGFGDYIIIDSLDLHDLSLTLVMPWMPADSLRGARRDSAIRFNLGRDDAEIRRAGRGFTRSWRWRDGQASFSYVRIADPDSAGQLVAIADARVIGSDPPFTFTNVRGSARRLADSIWLNLPHFDLPASTGSGSGKIVWGSGIPVRYAIKVIGDSVSLADIAWVYPTMPTTGGGRMRLDINNERDPKIVNYAIYEMDVRTTHSHLTGAMTYGVGGPVLRLLDVDLQASPLDFRLIRQFNGKPFPVDWAGTITGTVRGSGGPLHRFVVDEADVVFRDAHVRGAVSRLSGRGMLDILDPALTAFRGFDVVAHELDLRTPRHLFPSFPPLQGWVSGSATLDSVWTDVRFRNGDLVHHDGDGETSRATGQGRVTIGDEYLTYDLSLDADRVAFTTLARSFPQLPLRGSYRGPVRVQGTVEDLAVIASLSGPGGTLAVNGQFDLYPPGFGMRGLARLEDVDLRTLLARTDLPSTRLRVSLDAAMRGDSLANLVGTADVSTERSDYAQLRIHPSNARLRFENGLMRVDTLALETTAARVYGAGALGLVEGRSDSLAVAITVDSLGGLRSALGLRPRIIASGGEAPSSAEVASTNGHAAHANGASGPVPRAGPDSLAGMLWFNGALLGSVRELGVRGDLTGVEIAAGSATAARVTGTVALEDVTADPNGRLQMRLEDFRAGGFRLLDLTADIGLESLTSARVVFGATSPNGPTARLAANLAVHGDTTSALIDDVSISADSASSWRLARPTTFASFGGGWRLDSLELRREGGGRLIALATVPERAPIVATLRADDVPLADVGLFAQSRTPIEGRARFQLDVGGTRTEPTYRVGGTMRDVRMGDVAIEQLNLDGRYADRELVSALDLFRGGRRVITANLALPLDLALVPVEDRLRDAPLRGSIRTDSIELGIVETFTSAIRNSTGRLITNVDVAGTWERPALTGRLAVTDGAFDVPGAGIRLERVEARLGLVGDSVHIERLVAASRREDGQRADTASLSGWARFDDVENPELALRLFARDFRIVNRRSIGRLDVSTASPGLELDGRLDAARLSGSLVLESGQIVIPELVQKRPIDLGDPELLQQLDTTLLGTHRYLPSGPNRFVQGLQLQGVRLIIGEQVWLRSSEANIKLGGEVAVTKDPAPQNQRARLALEGTLSAARGTYKLDLGLVQRTFEVDTGRVVFYGDAELNPALDISALHTVRQYNKQDVRIRVHIGGTLEQPVLTLSSAEGLPISQPVLLSYLVSGQPTLDVGSTSTAASVLLPTAGSLLGNLITDRSGGLLDYVQVQTAGVQGLGLREVLEDRNARTSIFAGTSLGVGKQLTDRTFVSATAGLCRIFQPTDDTSVRDLVGVKVEHRFNHGFSLEVGSEPSSSDVLCRPIRGLIDRPAQLGFDLFRAWTF